MNTNGVTKRILFNTKGYGITAQKVNTINGKITGPITHLKESLPGLIIGRPAKFKSSGSAHRSIRVPGI